MAKENDININIKTPGAIESKRSLDQTAEGVRNVDASVDGAAQKADKAAGAFSKFIGLLGSAGLLTALATAAKKLAEFFDKIKQRCDEAVQAAGEVRQAYEGLFEAAGAFDEKSRKKVVKDTEQLLINAGATAQVGYPTIESFQRQFQGSMAPADYQIGLKNALNYAARHGGSATSELIQLMRGWNINTSGGQSEMYRLIMAASGQSGLTDDEMINLVGRASPVVRSMGWTPQQTISVLSSLAAGEVGRNKTMRPVQILEEYAKDQQKALAEYPSLSNIKMVTPISQADDRAENESFMKTMEARDAQAKARSRQIVTQIRTDTQYAEDVREIGRAAQKSLADESPTEQALLDALFSLTPKAAEEFAAYQKWERGLTESQHKEVRQKLKDYHKNNPLDVSRLRYLGDPAEREYWYNVMTPQDRFGALTDGRAASGNTVVNYNNYNNSYFNQDPPQAQPRSNGGI
ncbi:MAG TPA: hypothetical protein VLJ10_00420 [Candidatus Bathyarchaeia archaeon]|nr:hypothetical protein [Candidatus Bathyarchaeia archaeon]